jgi:hypothetical protein
LHLSRHGLAPAFSYSHSRGVFAGVSLDGTVIFSRATVNESFYGRAVSATDLLHGVLPPPRAAAPLYTALHEALSSPASAAALPEGRVEHVPPSPVIDRLHNIASDSVPLPPSALKDKNR